MDSPFPEQKKADRPPLCCFHLQKRRQPRAARTVLDASGRKGSPLKTSMPDFSIRSTLPLLSDSLGHQGWLEHGGGPGT